MTVSQSSGFVPIRFHLAGKLLLILGLIGIVCYGIDALTGWFALPSAVLIVSLIFIPVSLYLIFVVPRENEDDS